MRLQVSVAGLTERRTAGGKGGRADGPVELVGGRGRDETEAVRDVAPAWLDLVDREIVSCSDDGHGELN